MPFECKYAHENQAEFPVRKFRLFLFYYFVLPEP